MWIVSFLCSLIIAMCSTTDNLLNQQHSINLFFNTLFMIRLSNKDTRVIRESHTLCMSFLRNLGCLLVKNALTIIILSLAIIKVHKYNLPTYFIKQITQRQCFMVGANVTHFITLTDQNFLMPSSYAYVLNLV